MIETKNGWDISILKFCEQIDKHLIHMYIDMGETDMIGPVYITLKPPPPGAR